MYFSILFPSEGVVFGLSMIALGLIGLFGITLCFAFCLLVVVYGLCFGFFAFASCCEW